MSCCFFFYEDGHKLCPPRRSLTIVMKALTQRSDDARQIRKQTIKVVLNWGTSPRRHRLWRNSLLAASPLPKEKFSRLVKNRSSSCSSHWRVGDMSVMPTEPLN